MTIKYKDFLEACEFVAPQLEGMGFKAFAREEAGKEFGGGFSFSYKGEKLNLEIFLTAFHENSISFFLSQTTGPGWRVRFSNVYADLKMGPPQSIRNNCTSAKKLPNVLGAMVDQLDAVLKKIEQLNASPTPYEFDWD